MNAEFSTRSQEEIQAARAEGQNLFHQLYTNISIEGATSQIREAENNNYQAILLTIDSPADANRHRALRFGVGSADTSYTAFTWDYYQQLRNLADLPVVLKGIQTV